MRSLFVAAALLTSFAFGSAANAQMKDSDWDGGFRKGTAQRRSDLTVGLGAGLNVGRAHGYPNELGKIDNGNYEVSTGGAVGGGGALWLGGALSDWFTFAVGAASLNLQSEHARASGTAVIFRLESYPLFYEGGVWRDLGISGAFGLATLDISQDTKEDAEGGSMSLIGVGVFYEAWRFSYFAFGPTVEYTHLFSLPAEFDSVLFGARLAFYGGPD